MGDFYDFLVVGAGFSGAVVAERLASQLGRRVLVVDKRDHIGGNAYDCFNSEGILVHKYGAHIFHTSFPDVWSYLNGFARFNEYRHRVLVSVDGLLLPIPINRTTVNGILGVNYTQAEVARYFDSVKANIPHITNSRDVVVSQVGELFYEKLFKNYSFKHWGRYPEELSPEVTRRIPVRCNDDDRFFSDPYEGIPQEGYHALFERILAHRNITVLLGRDYKTILGQVSFDRLIYTGPVDYFFDYLHGPLPYRSQRFEFETLDTGCYQPVAVVNYPNDHEFTRIIESKHITFQQHPKTTIAREYSSAQGDPYYPVPTEGSREIYEKYAAEAAKLASVHFIGRLARYCYYNMDQAVKHSLALFEEIARG